jgi:putative CocE/NonD family hydrolase
MLPRPAALPPIFILLFAPLALLLAPPAHAQKQSVSPRVVVQQASTLDRYVGQYSFTREPEIVWSVFRKGGHLTVEARRMAAVSLAADGPLRFTSPEDGFSLVFVADAQGRVTGFERHEGSRVASARKVSSQPEPNHFRPYSRQEVMIPMRDGVKLHAIILRPTDTNQPLPFLMQRTPYGVDEYDSDTINERYTALAHSGYIFVMEDIRGRYESQGHFVMMRPLANHADPHAVDESTDAYDTVAWLLKHVPNNNGRVGVMGISYPGFLAMEAGIDPNPAVKAISPQAPMTDVWMGDDFFHYGAFRQSYGYDYALGMESSKVNAFGSLNEDAYNYFLQAGNFAGAIKKSGAGLLPTWKAFLKHPAYDAYWQKRAVEPHLTRVTVPTLEVSGWWDQEDMWGPQAEYAALEKHNQLNDPAHRVYLVIGPWNHGGWASTTRFLGAIDFGSATGDYFREHVEAPFFAYYLKGQSGFDLENTLTFRTGTDQWERYAQWPPRASRLKNLYLAANGGLTFESPAHPRSFTAYTSNPADPVPYRKRPIQATYAPGSHWYTWLAQDQRFVGARKDIARWQTPPLTHALTISGDVYADLLASTSGSDGDWVVKLIDVYPDTPNAGAPPTSPHEDTHLAGYQLMIAGQIFRGRYRTSFEHPRPTPPNQPEHYHFSLRGVDHVFLPGHRILVEVQSSWFPLYDRNPQTFVPNIMKAKPKDYRPATIHIYAGSHLELPVMPGA